MPRQKNHRLLDMHRFLPSLQAENVNYSLTGISFHLTSMILSQDPSACQDCETLISPFGFIWGKWLTLAILKGSISVYTAAIANEGDDKHHP